MNTAGARQNGQNGDFFSVRRQFARVVAADWRINHTDILYGIFYALIGFFLWTPRGSQNGATVSLIVPFIVTGIAMAFMAYRVCAAERATRTADLYFNLPRSRAVAWAAHVALLAGVALALDAVIVLGAAARLNLPAEALGYRIAPSMCALPLLALALAVWMIYLTPHWLWQIGGVSIFIIVWGGLLAGRGEVPWLAPGSRQEAVLTLSLLAVAGLLLAHSRYVWLKTRNETGR